jgi:putative SOS response-associated peptidase YedK
MCNNYAREIEAGRIVRLMKEMENSPPFSWEAGRIPNNADPTPHVRVRDSGLIVRLKDGELIGSMTTWAWQTPTKKPVFNFVSEHRIFAETERCLIPATGFYEHTEPKGTKSKLKDQHLFKMAQHEWFWIAGIVKYNAFATLTTSPGPDVQAYHDRQICVLPPKAGMEWLTLSKSEEELLTPLPRGSLTVRTLREGGEVVSSVSNNSRPRLPL